MGELAAAIQQRPDLRGSTIMMLSSVGQRGDAARCKALGVAAYMTKPVRQSVLLDAIHATLSGTPGNPTHERPLVTQHSLREEKHRSLRVLLAEDNPVNRALIIQLLKKRGHQVTVAENGREAVQCHASDPLDVILMDVQMPEMDGFEATAAIREKEATSGRHIPIIALTAHAMTGDRERCLAAGMDYYLTKPVRPAELYETLEVAVAQVHGGAEGKHETGQAPAKTKAESSSDATDMEFDPTEALATVADDKELLAQMVQLFCTESPRMMAAIRSSVEASDAPALMRSAHALKGSAGNFGSSPTCESARMLEQMGRDGILTGARQQLTALETQVSRLERDLSAFVRKVA